MWYSFGRKYCASLFIKCMTPCKMVHPVWILYMYNIPSAETSGQSRIRSWDSGCGFPTIFSWYVQEISFMINPPQSCSFQFDTYKNQLLTSWKLDHKQRIHHVCKMTTDITIVLHTRLANRSVMKIKSEKLYYDGSKWIYFLCKLLTIILNILSENKSGMKITFNINI